MTLNDPLLTELKRHIATILNRGPDLGPIHDEDEILLPLCICLESIFTKGLWKLEGYTPWKIDCFQWFYQLMRKYQKDIPLVFKLAFEETLNDPKTKTPEGKARLLIRTCLKKHCLYIPVQYHVQNRDFDDPSLRINYKSNSILGHEIFSQIFLSLLQQISYSEFSLDLNNGSFLDESWQLPSILRLDVVPCKRLGLTLGFPMGFAVCVEVVEDSCAEGLEQIRVGDILDEVNGICVRNYFGHKINGLFKKVKTKPFTLSVIKGQSLSTREVYLPIIKLYQVLGLDPDTVLGDSSSGPGVMSPAKSINAPQKPLKSATNKGSPSEGQEKDGKKENSKGSLNSYSSEVEQLLV